MPNLCPLRVSANHPGAGPGTKIVPLKTKQMVKYSYNPPLHCVQREKQDCNGSYGHLLAAGHISQTSCKVPIPP